MWFCMLLGGFWIFFQNFLSFGGLRGPNSTHFLYYSSIIHKNRHFCEKNFFVGGLTKKIKKFFCQFSGADFSLVIEFSVKWTSAPLRAWSQLSKMVWHLKIRLKLSVLQPEDWGVVFLSKNWPKLQGAIWGTKSQNFFEKKVFLGNPG